MEDLSGIADRHPQFLDAEPLWSSIRHAIDGAHAVKANGYLPELSAHLGNRAARDAYVKRAVWFNATARTIDALTGAAMRREPIVTVPRRFMPRLDDVSNQGESFHNFCKKAIRETLSYGRYIFMVDIPPPGGGNSLNPLDRLPYIVGYSAQCLTNWRPTVRHGRQILDQAVFLEHVPVPTRFGGRLEVQYRLLAACRT
jgi:hypothetical protein